MRERAHLTASGDVMTPEIGGTLVTPLSHRVWGADALSGVGVAVIPHMGALACWEGGRGGRV